MNVFVVQLELSPPTILVLVWVFLVDCVRQVLSQLMVVVVNHALQVTLHQLQVFLLVILAHVVIKLMVPLMNVKCVHLVNFPIWVVIVLLVHQIPLQLLLHLVNA